MHRSIIEPPKEVRIVLTHPDAKIPVRAHDTDTGYDIYAVSVEYNLTYNFLEYNTGLILIPPPGYYFEIVPRSSITKTDLFIQNSPCVIDESYRGEVKLRFRVGNDYKLEPFKPGDRIAQAILRKRLDAEFIQIKQEDIPNTQRGGGGFGSTGTN